MEALKKIAEQFEIEGEIKELYLFGNGHINTTYKVVTDKNAYTLQKINKNVFPSPADIMENSVGVTSFLAKKIAERGGDVNRETLHFLKAEGEKFYVVDENGDYWRSWIFIDNATAHEVVTGPEMLTESGRAFGEFQRQLADYPAETLHEVIKDFHNTPARFKQLTDAIEANNKVSFCVYDTGYRKEGEWALNISNVIVFGKMYIVEDFEKSMEICKKLSLKYTPDLEYIEDEIRTYGKATRCYELRPEHITGKIVNES